MKNYLEILTAVPPLWELDQFVAVNPFVHRLERPFATVMEEEEGRTGRVHLPPPGEAVPEDPRLPWRPDELSRLVGPFLASYFGSAVVPAPWRGLPLYTAWLASIPGSAGLAPRKARELKALALGLPDQPAEVLDTLGVEPRRLARLLETVAGWASLARRREWPGLPSPQGPLVALAAMVAVLDQVCPLPPPGPRASLPEFSARLEALERREAEVRRWVARELRPRNPAKTPTIRAVFCIDVRSEVFRRHWEAADPRVETDGFAGFFGVPMAWDGGGGTKNHLPVLASPQVTLRGPSPGAGPRSVLITSGTPNFPGVELTGWKALGDLLSVRRNRKSTPSCPWEGLGPGVIRVGRDQKVAWARGLLTHLGWINRWAPVHVFVGHGSHSTNNAHAAGLDCGACGGQTGEASARAAAALLNDSETRAGLEAMGIQIPPTTRFVAALHNTTADTVTFLVGGLPELEPGFRERCQNALELAGAQSRRERELRFRFLGTTADSRSRHPAETRPEAGLAGNAVFLAVPRRWTQGAHLDGRAFLHSYEPSEDPDGSLLGAILTGPAVVASWINLQYFASAVAPDVYGAGNKVLHSRIGTLGVVEGNGGDLKAGLPWQSVRFDGDLYHEPLRLQVMVAAPFDRVQAVVEAHPTLRTLVEGQWVILSVLGDDGTIHRWPAAS